MQTASPITSTKKPLATFRVREAETLKTTSAFYVPGCEEPIPTLS